MAKQAEMNAVTLQTDFKAPSGYEARFKVLDTQRVRIILKKQPSDPFEGAGDWHPSLPSAESKDKAGT